MEMETQTQNNKKLTPAQRSDLAYDVQGTLKHLRAGIMAIWAYMNGGKEPLERLFRHPKYHGQKEKPYIEEIARKLAESDNFPKYNISLMDLGHGQATEKVISFIDAFNEAANKNLADDEKPSNRFKEVIGIDIVAEYGKAFKDGLSTHMNKVAEHYGDEQAAAVRTITRQYSKIDKPMEVEGDPVMVSFNSPLWNSPLNIEDMTPADILPKALNYAARILDVEGYLVTNHYLSSPDDEELYDGEDCRNAIGAILRLIENELTPVCHDRETGEQVAFSRCFGYKTVYDAETNTRRMDVVSNGNITVGIGDHFIKTMDEGESFCFVSAAKLGKKEFEQHVKNARAFELPAADHRLAMRDKDTNDIFGYSCATKVVSKPEL